MIPVVIVWAVVMPMEPTRPAGENIAFGELTAARIQRPTWVPRRFGEPPDEYALPSWMQPEITPELLRVVGTRWNGAGCGEVVWYRESDPSFGWQMARLHKPLRDAEVPPPWVCDRR